MRTKTKRSTKHIKQKPDSIIAEDQIARLLQQLKIGETITLVNSKGSPLGVLVALNPKAASAFSTTEWLSKLAPLANEVGRKWNSSKSAAETVAEMRR
jgi:hypothetical protein